ncbi:methyltransferase family protein [Agromyces soli]
MRWGRAYFAVQAIGGAAWWIAVFASPLVREATLGGLDPVVVALLDLPLFVGASALAAAGVRWAAWVATGWTLAVTAALTVYALVTGLAGWGVLAMIAASCGSLAALALVQLGRLPTEWVTLGPLGFKPAGRRSGWRGRLADVLGTALEIVVFWGLFLVVIPLALAFFEQRCGLVVDAGAEGQEIGAALRWAALALLLLASALGIWAAAVMSTKGEGTPLPAAMPNRFVIAGPYRFVRNPMALAGIAQGVAVGILLSSWLVVVYAIAGALFWHFVVRPLEEVDLETRYGDGFRRYRAAVRCWWPRLRPVDAAVIASGVEPSPLPRVESIR